VRCGLPCEGVSGIGKGSSLTELSPFSSISLKTLISHLKRLRSPSAIGFSVISFPRCAGAAKAAITIDRQHQTLFSHVFGSGPHEEAPRSLRRGARPTRRMRGPSGPARALILRRRPRVPLQRAEKTVEPLGLRRGRESLVPEIAASIPSPSRREARRAGSDTRSEKACRDPCRRHVQPPHGGGQDHPPSREGNPAEPLSSSARVNPGPKL
jgi:hypothetical protein